MKRNVNNICPECDAGDPTSVIRECDCASGAPVTAPGPWARLRQLAVEIEHGLKRTGNLHDALAALPDPREADAAGEALDALEAFQCYMPVDAQDKCRAILRRAGRV